ncbi:hypothetical protein M409DRAFT_16863 [Zasmidium cellare ATCC 36951]|uniref:Rhodopsin domain-containing protein n=1 Tax=Zasmidium cellare ATCC 36951 TaxID=1080233 RepID=A0A6A6D385_ZASCE|nr:uncharacterized protein M409DRAFT_16863 [Zasmidium cellare ATCC 36951]KAF2172908.1 hypothetical protein M409DRAFT_16863 [Zasmidium cellare ATCC 36951]
MSSPLDLGSLFDSLQDEPDVNRGPLVDKVVWVFISISIIIVALRFWTKWRTTNRLYIDDGLMLMALLVGITHSAIITRAVSTGFGRHIIYLTLEEVQKTMKFGILSLMFDILSPTIGRISFAYTLLMITRSDPRTKTWPIWMFIVLQVLVNFVGITLFYVQCGSHSNVYWNVMEQVSYHDYCWSPKIQTRYGYFMGAFNVVTDAFLAVFPALLIEQTRLSRKTKIGLWCLLGLSAFAMIAAVVKTYEAKMLSKVTDYTYNLCFYVIWVSVELNIVIVTASIPLLRPLFKSKKRHEGRPPNELGDVHLGSVTSFGKNVSRMHTPQHTSTSSLDNIVHYDDTAGVDSAGIVVTREVQVSYETKDAPNVHAALVGLLQGEIANPRLARG